MKQHRSCIRFEHFDDLNPLHRLKLLGRLGDALHVIQHFDMFLISAIIRQAAQRFYKECCAFLRMRFEYLSEY